MEKFVLTGKTKTMLGVELHQIQAAKTFRNVKEGDLGGYVESEKNLSHDGNAWVADEAMAMGKALVSGNALMTDYSIARERAEVSGDTIMTDYGQASGDARLFHNARVSESGSVSGKVMMFERACVTGNAFVDNDAVLSGDAYVDESNKYYCVYDSDNEVMTAFATKDGGVSVHHEMFTRTIDEYEEWINEIHGGSQTGDEYRAIIALFRVRFQMNAGKVTTKYEEKKIMSSMQARLMIERDKIVHEVTQVKAEKTSFLNRVEEACYYGKKDTDWGHVMVSYALGVDKNDTKLKKLEEQRELLEALILKAQGEC